MAKAKSPAKSLVATDSRFPLTAALAEACAGREISAEILALRKKEMTELVAQAAKTFGFQSKTSLAQSLDLTIGLLSLALADSTRGETLPRQWAEQAATRSWKELLKESLAMVRSVKEGDDAHAYLFEGEKDPATLRDHLRDFALRRDRHQQWIGYAAFSHYKAERQRNQTLDTLVRWLIKSLVKRPLLWKDSFDGPACADEALNTLLFRACTGLGFGQKDILLAEKDFRKIRAEYDSESEKWLKDGRKRYDILQLSVPDELQPALDKKWFEKAFEKGPPKVRKWDSEDLPGITGFYYYQTYE